MALAHATQLLNEAMEGGRRLNARERRLCIQYLQATQPETTNTEMAEWFQVSERTVRDDKVWIRSEKAKFLKDELAKDLSLVIADIAMDFEKQVSDIEKSKGKCKLGTKPYVDHCNSIFDMRLKMVKAFQDIGYLPKNLGNMTVDKFEYKAVVLRDGSTVTRPVDMKFGEGEVIDVPAQLPPASLEKQENVENRTTASSLSETVGDS